MRINLLHAQVMKYSADIQSYSNKVLRSNFRDDLLFPQKLQDVLIKFRGINLNQETFIVLSYSFLKFYSIIMRLNELKKDWMCFNMIKIRVQRCA